MESKQFRRHISEQQMKDIEFENGLITYDEYEKYLYEIDYLGKNGFSDLSEPDDAKAFNPAVPSDSSLPVPAKTSAQQGSTAHPNVSSASTEDFVSVSHDPREGSPGSSESVNSAMSPERRAELKRQYRAYINEINANAAKMAAVEQRRRDRKNSWLGKIFL